MPRALKAKLAPVLRHVVISNYKSIVYSRISFKPCTFIVGRNASGKSTLLDALDFIADALYESPDDAMRSRGGAGNIISRSPRIVETNRLSFGVSLDLSLVTGVKAQYTARFDPTSRGDYEISMENCTVGDQRFNWLDGHIDSTLELMPRHHKGRLLLNSLAGVDGFGDVFDAITNLRIYNPDIDEMKSFQSPDSGDRLADDAWNAASVVRSMAAHSSEKKKKIERYLAAISPGLIGVDCAELGPSESLVFTQETSNGVPNSFYGRSMSDGTLRSLAILLAIFQESPTDDNVSLAAIEEPERGLHPRATSIMYDAIIDASEHRQIIATSHSPELLDRFDLKPESVLIAEIKNGSTSFRHPDKAAVELMKDGMSTAGELLRQNQLDGDVTIVDPEP